jgi:hypothetical protein
MEVDEDDVWGAVASSPSTSPPPAISTSLSLNTRLQLLAASGGVGVGVGGTPFHPGGGCYRNVAASPSSSSFFSPAAASSFLPRLAPLDAGPARRALEREMCLGPSSAAAAAGASGGPVEQRKKRMIKNRESASRSRARKQAHANQIETEVADLREQNQELRDKYEQVYYIQDPLVFSQSRNHFSWQEFD